MSHDRQDDRDRTATPAPVRRHVVDRHPAEATAPNRARLVFGLQRQVGNRAVTETLGRTPIMQRFVGTEHKQLGDSTGRVIDLGNGVRLSWGDIVALAGDEYGSVDELLADTKDQAGKQRLLAAIREDHIPDPGTTTLPEPTDKQKSDRFLAFVKLAAENPTHFNDNGQAIGRWAVDHAIAVDASLSAGLADDASGRQLAQAREAFAQHFLTDAFSGGHIRTPRPNIIAWYRKNFGPPVVDALVSQLTNRLIEGLVAQVSPQTMAPDFMVRSKIKKAVGKKVAAAIAGLGGRAQLTDYVALGVAGIVSGAMHDMEGKRGVTVSSEAHPAPWTAFGDAQLGDSPVSRAQAELAVATAAGHLDTAFEIGRRHAASADPARAPKVTYAGFASAAVAAGDLAGLKAAAGYLHAHPEVQVTLTGHTDPTGSEAYNDDLGLQRAQAAARELIAGGARAEQIVVQSLGRRAPVTTSAAQFRLNRRVTYDYVSRPGPYLTTLRDEASAELSARVAAPYADVTRFVPRPLADAVATPAAGVSGGASNTPLEEWRWGSVPANLRGEIDGWVRGYGSVLNAAIASAKDLDDTQEEGFEIHPRPLAQAIVNDLLKDPSGFLESALGRPMSR